MIGFVLDTLSKEAQTVSITDCQAGNPCFEQAKTINGEVQLQALVDGKKIIDTEASVRSDLQLDDEEGTDCLLNATIFKQLTLMGYEKLSQKLTFYMAFFSPQWKFLIHTILQCLSAKTTAWNEFSSTMASTIICLAINQKFNFSKTQSKATPNEPSSPGTSSGGGPRRQETIGDTIAQTRYENVSKLSNDPLLARDHQAMRIGQFERGSMKLKKKDGKELIAQKIIQDMYGVNGLDDDEGECCHVDVAKDTVVIIEKVTTILTLIATATAASTRPRAKGIVIHEQEQAPTPTVSSQQPSQVKARDKGKGFGLSEDKKKKRIVRVKAKQVEEAI
ncbi:hypothetical protein Tco_0189353 [Tanacetum coccineum]